MKIGNFEIIISTLPHKERPIAEIYYKNMYWAQISQETDDLAINFYSHPIKKCWEFSFDQAMQILEQAKDKLLH